MSRVRKCLFCDNPGTSREHLWGKWLLEVSGQKGKRKDTTSHLMRIGNNRGPDNKQFPGPLSQNGNSVGVRRKLVCRECNNGWMSQIEQMAKGQFLECLMGKRLIDETDLKPMALWICLKSTLIVQAALENIDEFYGQLISDQSVAMLRSGEIPRDFTVAVGLVEDGNWGGHNISFYPCPHFETTHFAMFAAVGGVAFLCANNKDVRPHLSKIAGRNKSMFRIAAPRIYGMDERHLWPHRQNHWEHLLRQVVPSEAVVDFHQAPDREL